MKTVIRLHPRSNTGKMSEIEEYSSQPPIYGMLHLMASGYYEKVEAVKVYDDEQTSDAVIVSLSGGEAYLYACDILKRGWKEA